MMPGRRRIMRASALLLLFAMGLGVMAPGCIPAIGIPPSDMVQATPALLSLPEPASGKKHTLAPPHTLPVAETHGAARMSDGVELPYVQWRPTLRPVEGVIVALHGFNDYRNAFAAVGPLLAASGQAVFAYDQRGFGLNPHPGSWAGVGRMTADLSQMTDLVRAQYPGRPVTLLGVSMGGAVVLSALAQPIPPAADRAVLVAPAVWGRATMPFYQRAALWLGAHTVPWMTLTGRGLKRWASDHLDMLRRLGRDPLVVKETRIEAIWGLVNLMDAALEAGPPASVPSLILYGRHDQIVPAGPLCRLLDRDWAQVPQQPRMALYPEGWHMLLRDLNGPLVLRDILAWLDDAKAPLPSGSEAPGAWPDGLCGPKRLAAPAS